MAAEHPATCGWRTSAPWCAPGGDYTTTVDGVQLRDGDGVHIVPTPAAGQWLADHLLPEVVQVGRLQKAGRSLRFPDGPRHRGPGTHHLGLAALTR